MKGNVNNSEHPVEFLQPQTTLNSSAAATAYNPLVYNGGPILTAPELVSFYWGAFTQAEIGGMQDWLKAFAGYLSNQGAPVGQEQPILQYGTFGGTVGASHTESAAPASATETEVKNKILALQQSGQLPPFSQQRLFLVFTKEVQFTDYGTKWCGYHGSWGGGQYFAICPYPSAGGCGADNPIPSWQSVTSHEILEAATDPDVGSGWIEGGEEGGDSCAWQSVSLPFGTVQRFADNLQKACSVWTIQESSSLTAASWGPNRLDILARGLDGAMWHKWWDGNQWGGWESLGGQIVGAPSVVFWGPNRLDVLARGLDGAMWHRWWDGNQWGGWESLGGQIVGSPKAVAWSANRLDILALGLDGSVWHKWWDGNQWGGWESLGGQIVGPPNVVSWGPNRLDILARGLDGAMWHKWWDGNQWGGWESLGGQIVGSPVTVTWGPNRLDILARGLDGAMWHRWWDGNQWGSWESLGGQVT